MSLRARLLLLVTLATLVPAVLLGIRFFQDRSAQIEAGLMRLATMANNITHDLDEKIQGTAQLQFGLSRAANLHTDSREGCSAFLSAVREEYEQYTGILTIAPNGKLFCDSLQTHRELDLNDRQYFKEALVTSDAVTLQPAVGRLTGISVLQIAYPARTEAGDLKFVLLASFDLRKFVNQYLTRLPSGIDILLVDKAGTILVTPHREDWTAQAGASIAGTDLFAIATGEASGRASEVTDADGSKQYWAAVKSPDRRDSGMYVMVGMSRESLVGAANQRLNEDLAILGLLSVLLFAGVLTLAEIGVRRQVGRIAAMAKKLGSGDFTSRIAAPYPNGELGGLMIELNATAESLQRHHDAIDDLVGQLHRSQDIEARTKVFLDTVIEHIPHPISVKARQPNDAGVWKLMLVNKAYEGLAGLPRDKLIGRSARDLYSGEAADIIVASDEDALVATGAVITREFRLNTGNNGERLLASKRIAIRDDNGEAQYLLTVLEDVTEKRIAERKIAHMAHYDALTDLPNRAAFNCCFAATLENAAKTGEQFTILSIDLARFKETNDVYGHAAGDALLQEVAHRLQAVAGDAFIARIGGDEFTLIIGGGEDKATAVAHRLLSAFAGTFEVEGKAIEIGLGIGGAVYPKDGTDAKTLMIGADAALYRAKAEPRPTVMFFQAEMGARLQERHNLQLDLKAAIDQGELSLHYQPQFKIDGEAVGFEALARWHSPTRGMVPPSSFIPVAEEYNLIIPLGEWALRSACREAASWSNPLTVAVNVSPIQFHHGDLPGLVHAILLETGLAPGRLELEITEGVLINDFSRAVSILRRLKSLGVQIVLDDFGKGYSSLSYLHSFPFDKIKIDRAFICDLEDNHHSMAIVRAVIGLGQSLRIPILAEGVETESQRTFLRQAGCGEMQGYLAGRPYPIDDYAQLTGGQRPAARAFADGKAGNGQFGNGTFANGKIANDKVPNGKVPKGRVAKGMRR
jgi:diguanylate cyclase (GGDEF)-like protein/PAS domain S-box-containing protein